VPSKALIVVNRNALISPNKLVLENHKSGKNWPVEQKIKVRTAVEEEEENILLHR